MKLLLDTHFVLWVALVRSELNSVERDLLGREDYVVSAVSLWELRIKWHSFHTSGARKGPADPMAVIEMLRRDQRDILDFTADHAVAKLGVPLSHKDPFDELLLVQAQQEGLQLLTRDRLLADHPLVWR